jgi:hypothetical protein
MNIEQGTPNFEVTHNFYIRYSMFLVRYSAFIHPLNIVSDLFLLP